MRGREASGSFETGRDKDLGVYSRPGDEAASRSRDFGGNGERQAGETGSEEAAEALICRQEAQRLSSRGAWGSGPDRYLAGSALSG